MSHPGQVKCRGPVYLGSLGLMEYFRKGRVVYRTITYAAISYICKKYDYKPITIGERVLKFIKENPHLSISEQARQLGLEIHALMNHYSRAGLTTKGKQENIESDKTPLSQGAQEYMNDIIKSCQPKKEIDRKAFTIYNQTGSDLLDEYRGIKTTERSEKLL